MAHLNAVLFFKKANLQKFKGTKRKICEKFQFDLDYERVNQGDRFKMKFVGCAEKSEQDQTSASVAVSFLQTPAKFA